MAVNVRLLKAIIELKHYYYQVQQSSHLRGGTAAQGALQVRGSPPMPYVAFGLDCFPLPSGWVGIYAGGRIIKTQYFILLLRGQSNWEVAEYYWVSSDDEKGVIRQRTPVKESWKYFVTPLKNIRIEKREDDSQTFYILMMQLRQNTQKTGATVFG